MDFNSIRSPRRLAVTALLFCAVGATGCQLFEKDTSKLDAVERAKLITENLKEGDVIFQRIRDEIDIRDPDNADLIVSELQKAKDYYKEALDLDIESRSGEPSFKPRLKYALVLNLISLVSRIPAEEADAKIEKLKERGEPIPKELKEKSERYWKSARQYATDSQRHVDYYLRVLQTRFPRPAIIEAKATNFYTLGEYELAADWILRYAESLPDQAKPFYREQARRWQEQAAASESN